MLHVVAQHALKTFRGIFWDLQSRSDVHPVGEAIPKRTREPLSWSYW
jgi:hypothetical protein